MFQNTFNNKAGVTGMDALPKNNMKLIIGMLQGAILTKRISAIQSKTVLKRVRENL